MTNESKACLKCSKYIDSNDVIPRKRKTQGKIHEKLDTLEDTIYKMTDQSKIKELIAFKEATIEQITHKEAHIEQIVLEETHIKQIAPEEVHIEQIVSKKAHIE